MSISLVFVPAIMYLIDMASRITAALLAVALLVSGQAARPAVQFAARATDATTQA